MEAAGFLHNATPIMRDYLVGETIARGQPVISGATANATGVVLPSTTAAANLVGLALEDATRATAQQADGSDPGAYVRTLVNPGLLLKARLSGGATTGTQLALITNTVQSTDGLTITATGFTAAMDDFYCWGFSGANAGILRKLEDVSAGTDADTEIAFPRDIEVGDTFLAATVAPAEAQGVQLTSDFQEIDATNDNSAGTNFRCVELLFLDENNEGRLKSAALLVANDHLFGAG